MILCLICHEPTKDSTRDFCEHCLHMDVAELDRQYKERTSDTRKDDQEAPSVSEPVTENTHR